MNEDKPKHRCIWPDCGHDTNQSNPDPACNGKYCPKPETAPASHDAQRVETMNIPAAQALIAAVGPGYRVIYRDAFRWKDDRGHVLPNHYECHNAPYLATEYGHELVLDLGFAAILIDKRAPECTTKPEAAGALAGEGDAVKALRDLRQGYVRLLESGRDRIRDLGGECDPVDMMERSDPYLRRTDLAIAALSAAPAPAQQPAVVGDVLAVLDAVTQLNFGDDDGDFSMADVEAARAAVAGLINSNKTLERANKQLHDHGKAMYAEITALRRALAEYPAKNPQQMQARKVCDGVLKLAEEMGS